jgi:antirestriction protein
MNRAVATREASIGIVRPGDNMMSDKTEKNDPRVYVGTYGKYNSGSIRGQWLNLTDYADREEFLAACADLHKDEHDPEFMFQDHVNIPDGMISESSIEAELWEWLAMNDEDKELLAVYRKHVDQSGTLEQARDGFMGTFESEEDWAEDFLEEGGLLNEVPESLRGYIDYEKYARDASYNGMSFVRHNGKLWVFNPS